MISTITRQSIDEHVRRTVQQAIEHNTVLAIADEAEMIARAHGVMGFKPDIEDLLSSAGLAARVAMKLPANVRAPARAGI